VAQIAAAKMERTLTPWVTTRAGVRIAAKHRSRPAPILEKLGSNVTVALRPRLLYRAQRRQALPAAHWPARKALPRTSVLVAPLALSFSKCDS
jgi:hypothetical protein